MLIVEYGLACVTIVMIAMNIISRLTKSIQYRSRRAWEKSAAGRTTYNFRNYRKPKFTCPICQYRGAFRDFSGEGYSTTGVRLNAQCIKCGSKERHRLQYLVMLELAQSHDFSIVSFLHIAPEPFFIKHFTKWFERYETADLHMEGVNHKADITNLPFDEGSYDVVFASHVLEHVKNDISAIREVHRVLRTGGIAILPVPINADQTVEYGEPNTDEWGHVRAPGLDYIDRYASVFNKVDRYTSDEFPPKFQLYLYEDRSVYPTDTIPLRPAQSGEKHLDCVPVCYKS